MIDPYIGVTGFMNSHEVGAILWSLPKTSHHRLMAGVLASSKTVRGQPNRWPGRFPTMDTIGDIFLPHPRVLNLVHYSTDTPESLAAECRTVLQLAGPHCHGLQLNVRWPDPAQLVDLRLACPRAKVILQLGSKAMAEEGDDPERIIERLVYGYHDLLDGVLFDPSGGLGQPFNPAVATCFIQLAREMGLDCALGVAGGLAPETIALLAPVVKILPTVSIDAEGRLRTPPPEDALDIDRASAYVQAACALLAQT